MPCRLEKYIVEKGSIAVDGISLTVTGVKKINSKELLFGVAVILILWKILRSG